MNFNHLEFFITLAKIQNYTKAAELLYITQPSLTYAISNLEKELGVRLFQKKGRNIELTIAGEIFYKEISSGVNSINAALNKMESISKGSGFINIGSLRTLTKKFVPVTLKSFKEINPNLDISFKIHTSTGLSVDLVEGLKRKEYDVVFTSFIKNQPNISFYPVFEQKLVIIVHQQHELAKYDELDIKDIINYDFISFGNTSGLFNVIESMFSEHNLKPHIVQSASEDETIAGLVGANFGISIVPIMSILNELPVKIIKIKNSSVRRLFYLATLKNSYKLPVLNKYISYVIEKYKIKFENSDLQI